MDEAGLLPPRSIRLLPPTISLDLSLVYHHGVRRPCQCAECAGVPSSYCPVVCLRSQQPPASPATSTLVPSGNFTSTATLPTFNSFVRNNVEEAAATKPKTKTKKKKVSFFVVPLRVRLTWFFCYSPSTPSRQTLCFQPHAFITSGIVRSEPAHATYSEFLARPNHIIFLPCIMR